jgi:hypothetical protein
VRILQHRDREGTSAAPTREEFADLAADLESLWNDSNTDARLKKRIIRTLIHDIVVDVDAQAGEVILVIHWKGGVHTELRLPRRRRGQNSAHTSTEVRIRFEIRAREVIEDHLHVQAQQVGHAEEDLALDRLLVRTARARR